MMDYWLLRAWPQWNSLRVEGSFEWDMYIASIVEDGLTGMDFLFANSYELGYRHGLRLNGQGVPTESQLVNIRAARLTLLEDMDIPPQSEWVVGGELGPQQGTINSEYGLVEHLPYATLGGLLVGQTLVDPAQSNVPVRLLNVSSGPVKLRKGTTVALLHEVEAAGAPVGNSPACIVPMQCVKPAASEWLAPLQELFEKTNKVMSDMIASYIDGEQREWDIHLPLPTFAYCCCKHTTTNLLITGREAIMPVELQVGSGPPGFGAECCCDYVRKVWGKSSSLHAMARKHLKTATERHQRDYDAQISEHQYQVGDLVYYKNTAKTVGLGKSPKLEPNRWLGPAMPEWLILHCERRTSSQSSDGAPWQPEALPDPRRTSVGLGAAKAAEACSRQTRSRTRYRSRWCTPWGKVQHQCCPLDTCCKGGCSGIHHPPVPWR